MELEFNIESRIAAKQSRIVQNRTKTKRNYTSGCIPTPLVGSVEEKRRISPKNKKHRRTLRVNNANQGTHHSHVFEDKREIRPSDTQPAQNVLIEGELLSYPPIPPENIIIEGYEIKAKIVLLPKDRYDHIDI